VRRGDRRRRRRAWRRRAPEWTALASLAATVVIGPQLLGGVYGWGIAILTALAGLSALSAFWWAHVEGKRRPVGLAGAIGIVGLGWTLLQAVPLPRGLTAQLQPRAVQLADASAALFGDGPPGWVALSIAPGQTWAEVVKGAGLLGVFFAAAVLVGMGHRRRVLMIAGTSAAAMAAVALLHTVVGAELVFGIYDPIHTTNPLVAPIVNQNQLSGFLAMGTPVLVGIGLDSEEPRSRWMWLTAAAITGATALAAVSRGGATSLVVGLLTLALLGVVRRRGRSGKPVAPSLAWLGATFAAAAGLGLYVAAEGLYRDFEQSGIGKLQLAAEGLDLAAAHPFVGVGRGAFSAAMVTDHGSSHRFTHPENIVAQWAAEWGFVVALAVFVGLAVAIVRATRQTRSWARMGAVAALVGIFAHDLVDFSLELAGVAAVAAALAGAVVAEGRRRSGQPRTRHRRIGLARAALATAVVCVVLTATLGWRLHERSLYHLQDELQAALVARDADRFRGTLQTAMSTHPSEPAVMLLAGAEAAHRGDPVALRWLNRSMLLAPGWPGPHEEAARYLIRRGHLAQALGEVREAAQRGRHDAVRILCPFIERFPDRASVVIREYRSDELGLELLDRTAACLPTRSPAAIEIDALLARQQVLGAIRRIARREIDRGEPLRALNALRSVPRAERLEEPVLLLRARALTDAERPEEALIHLAEAQQTDAVLAAIARAQALGGDEGAMRATFDALRARQGGDASRIARLFIQEGHMHREIGNQFGAMRAYGRAQRLDPESGALPHIGATSERVGDLGRAFGAWAELCQRQGAGSRACAARDRVAGQLRERRHERTQQLGVP